MQKRIKAFIRPIKYKLLYAVAVALIWVANAFPRRAWLYVCTILGRAAARLAPGLRRKIELNLANAFHGDEVNIKNLSKDVMIMLMKNAGVVLRDFKTSPERYYKQTIVHGVRHAEEAFHSGRGVIFLAAHIGPYESLAHELCLRGFNPYIIGVQLKDSGINALLSANRTRFGGVAVERGKETRRLMKNLLAGGTMAILIDQDTSVKSVFVDFFGKRCSTPAGAALIALKTGASVIPVFSHLDERDNHVIEYYPEILLTVTGDEQADILSNTQKFTDAIEREIRKFPAQWVWMHRRWKTQG
jgi:KDO2-lipid IV(A) lauroyltransferase